MAALGASIHGTAAAAAANARFQASVATKGARDVYTAQVRKKQQQKAATRAERFPSSLYVYTVQLGSTALPDALPKGGVQTSRSRQAVNKI